MADMWHIVPQGQRQSTQLNAGGTGFQTVWEITYQIDSGPAQGTQAQVIIPSDFYSADYVKTAIDAAVAHIDEVAGL
jgi:hypothetical protein